MPDTVKLHTVDSPGMLLPGNDPEWEVGEYLKRRKLALAQVEFYPAADLMDLVHALKKIEDRALVYPTGMWVHRVAKWAGIRPQFILMVLQSEQGLLSVAEGTDLSAGYSVSALIKGTERPTDLDDGSFLVRSKGGWLRVWGEKRMCMAAGAGIPDPGWEPPWNVGNYLGFDRQVYQVGRMARRDIDAWNKGERLVKLYGDKWAECQDLEAYVLLRWTPNPKVLIDRPRIYSDQELAA